MSIPDKAVEAAAQRQAQLDGRETWELMDLDVILRYRANSRAILEAAEPHLTGGLRDDIVKLRIFCDAEVDNSSNSEGEQAAYDEVSRGIGAILTRYPEVKS